MNRSTYSEFELGSRFRDVDGSSVDVGDALHEFFATLSLYRIMIAGLTVGALLIGILFAVTRTPIYRATSEVILSPDDTTLQGGGARTNMSGQAPNSGVVESEIQILQSSGLISLLVENVGLDRARQWVSRPAGAILPLGGASGELTEDQVVDAIRNALRVARRDNSYVLEISATTYDPAHSSELANNLVDTYMAAKTTDRLDASQNSSDWLSARLETLRDEVQTKERAVEDYRAEMDIIAVNGNTVAENQLGSIQRSLVDARASYTESRARLEQMRRLRSAGGSIETLSATLGSSVISELRRREADVAARRAELEQKYQAQHPDVRQVIREQDEIKGQIDAEVRRQMANLENEVEVAGIRVSELQKAQDGIERQLVTTNKDQVRLRALQREAEAASNLYQQYVMLQQQMAQEGSRRIVDARIVSLAKEPTSPVSAPPLLWVVFFGAVGLLVSLVVALLRRAFNNRLLRPEDIRKKLNVAPLVSIPLVSHSQLMRCPPDERSPAGMITARPMSRVAESIRVLLSQVVFDRVEGTGFVVAVTSALANEGKTTTTLSLGRVAAMSGQRVLLIEGDLRKRSLSSHAPAAEDADLVAVLKKNLDWRSAIVTDDATSAEILPAGKLGMQVGNLFSTARMRAVLQEMRAEYDLIIFDCPPILAVSDARTLAALADRTVIVTYWNRTPAPAVHAAVREAENAGGTTIGVVLNQLRTSVVKRISYADSLYLGKESAKYYYE